ncbi:MAG: aminopeptidase P family protein [Proteobacteria bacterium]|nr:aminopeptidase P family protein [Pseudomonadota bacterium]
MNIYAERIESIRAMMRDNGWDAVVVSGSDPHSSEYVAERWHQVEWISGYNGEGDLVITANHAGLWTDSRYFIQAGKQLPGTGIELHKTRLPESVTIPAWLAETFKTKDAVIAVDGLCQAISAIDDIKAAFVATKVRIVDVPDMLDALWIGRPAIPCTPVTIVSDAQTGRSRADKLAWLRQHLKSVNCDAIMLSALDEIAWTLNVRGSDVDYNPVVMSYLIVTHDDVQWFVRKAPTADAVSETSFAELAKSGVRILNYHDIGDALRDLMRGSGRLFIDPSSFNYSLYAELAADRIVTGKSPVILEKSIKTAVEIEGMRKAHYIDGIAVTRFLHWLEKSIQSGAKLSEWDGAVKLGEFRGAGEGYRGDSFETVSSWGEGAALPHYVTPNDGSTKIGDHGLFLCDSGGQYLFGTTDITRTVPLGPCTDLEKEDYTLVLKGHIDLAMAHFPDGTSGDQLDVLAREPLWRTHRFFGHGTGHGVGFYLNVHEGPQSIRQGFNRQPMLPGMITSNEPGIYREGMHGVRHENLVLCVDTGEEAFGRHWYRFETLTLCYFDTTPIIKGLLNDDEIRWLNDYNELVYQKLSPALPADVATWLRDKTRAI